MNLVFLPAFGTTAPPETVNKQQKQVNVFGALIIVSSVSVFYAIHLPLVELLSIQTVRESCLFAECSPAISLSDIHFVFILTINRKIINFPW